MGEARTAAAGHIVHMLAMDLRIMSTLGEIKENDTGVRTHMGEAKTPRHDHSRANVRQDGQNMRTERESKEKDTHKLIVEVAERLFRQIGFQKTTVADIARELHMSPANVYRFFAAKSEINEAVCMDLLGKIEAEAEKIAASRSTATQRIRNLIGSVEKTHHKQYMFDRKLHDLIEAAIAENWAIMRRHNERMASILEQIIASGMASGEFPLGDAALAARLVNTACLRFSHPRLIVEFEQDTEPTLDQMIGFCLTALSRQPA
ncbi:MAG TPA: TetR family transcriptional regulator [Methylocella sp.]|nr:TetR family transcriptional regulator [Methylocella sp.]